MKRFASLTSRLVVTAVALVLVVSVLIGTATALAMDSYLTSRLDDQISSSLERATRGGPAPPGEPRDGGINPSNQAPGTLIAILDEQPSGLVLTQTIGGDRELSTAALDALADVPVDGTVQEVDLPAFGTYRVAATSDASGTNFATGLPTAGVDEAVGSLVRWEALLTVLGVAVATGAGLFIVRRQLKPLREVAQTAHAVSELPLAAGEIELAERVPEHLTDEHTEVGQVGAALNTLLAHVESSLSARHRSEQQVRQFVADASHELRTPLSTIKGYAELARSRPDDVAATRAALDKVESQSVRMTALVEDLLLLARLDAGRPVEQLPVDLTRVLLEAVSDARILGPDHGWRLDLPAESVEVTGDEQRLHQVVTNLLTNARKHTPAETTVTVTVLPVDGPGPEGPGGGGPRGGGPDGQSWTEILVHDDGPGFPADLVGSAFERFSRADSSRARGAEGGAGLGLSLVDAIVTAHGGTVSLTTQPGDTTVRVRLPVRVTGD